MTDEQSDFMKAYDTNDVDKLVSLSKRWIVICVSEDYETVTMVSDDNENQPHVADLINIGLISGALQNMNASLYDVTDVKEV